MASSSTAQTIIDKLRDLPHDKLAEVEDFVDFLRDRQLRSPQSPQQLLRDAVARGYLTAPDPNCKRSSVSDVPPAIVPGTPPSEIVLQDRR